MLSHIDKKGNAKIVDISNKKITKRIAIASGMIFVTQEILEQIKKNESKKGDIFTVAKIAGIMAAKKTSDLIPLCHPLKIDDIQIAFNVDDSKKVIIAEAKVKCENKTGVEMEALTAISITLLTIYDMCKAVSHEMKITDVRLINKSGGKTNFSNQSI
jgi:cyclic pyranopterin phosphate synthase